MPCPFPGMDPYIEDRKLWPDFHARFVPYCCDALNERLPDSYIARLEEQCRVVGGTEEDAIDRRPDVAVEAWSGPAGWSGPATPESTAILEPQVATLPTVWTEEREVWVEVRWLPENRLVTVIELLSPTNKAPGSGFYEYQAKRREFLRERIHIVEIDLLLNGRRLPMKSGLPPGDYYALVSRAERRPHSDVYAWSVRRTLPTIPIPLLPPDPDAQIDLEAIFQTAYERGKYARVLRYQDELTAPLRPEDKTWAQEIAQVMARR